MIYILTYKYHMFVRLILASWTLQYKDIVLSE